MLVPFFGGWNFTPEDAKHQLPGAVGCTKGVRMGGDLTLAPAGKAPTFLVGALKDPLSGNLDRIQIVKGDSSPAPAARARDGWRTRAAPASLAAISR